MQDNTSNGCIWLFAIFATASVLMLFDHQINGLAAKMTKTLVGSRPWASSPSGYMGQVHSRMKATALADLIEWLQEFETHYNSLPLETTEESPAA